MRRPEHFPFRSAAARAEYLAFYDRRATRWPVPSETRTVPTTFGETFVRISGPEGAPPLVLLPGMSSNGLMWETLIEPFARRYRTYALDSVTDVGRSVPTRDIQSAADYTQWLDEVFGALDLRAVNLLGMSYGAWIAAHMALLRPERLRRTVWLAPAGVVARLSVRWVLLALLTAFSRWIHRRFTWWMFADAVKTPEGRRLAEELIADTQVMMRCYAPRPIVTPSRMTDAELRSHPRAHPAADRRARDGGLGDEGHAARARGGAADRGPSPRRRGARPADRAARSCDAEGARVSRRALT
jgi:pimeloyl-ACP methyl ester carboxylesterase